MTFEEYRDQLASALGMNLSSAGPSSKLEDDLALDSIAVYEVFLVTEELVGRQLPDELLDAIDTLGDAYNWVKDLGDR